MVSFRYVANLNNLSKYYVLLVRMINGQDTLTVSIRVLIIMIHHREYRTIYEFHANSFVSTNVFVPFFHASDNVAYTDQHHVYNSIHSLIVLIHQNVNNLASLTSQFLT